MVRDVVTERPDADILDAAKLMIDHDISALPVLDDGRQLIGILSEADLLHRPARLAFSARVFRLAELVQGRPCSLHFAWRWRQPSHR
ncbi:MAG: CBS domain-containing protein [Beijerinckiaceae bacterium]